MWRLGAALALVAAVAGAGAALDRNGYARGAAEAEAQGLAARAALADLVAVRDAALRAALENLAAAQVQRGPRVKGLENEAFADDGADGLGLGFDGVQRLGTRWGGSPD